MIRHPCNRRGAVKAGPRGTSIRCKQGRGRVQEVGLSRCPLATCACCAELFADACERDAFPIGGECCMITTHCRERTPPSMDSVSRADPVRYQVRPVAKEHGEECGEQSQRRDADRDPLRRGREECRHLRTRSGMQQEGGVEWHDRCPSRRPRRHPPSYPAKPLSRRSNLGLIQRRCFFASCSAAGRTWERISAPHPWLW